MCCLFGLIDYGNNFSGRQKSKILSILAAECEVRGTDATGIAYQSGGKLRIFKRPVAAHRLRFHLPDDVHAIMGHTRMTTQGSERQNFNNHPFRGIAGGVPFALAHNGVLHNDHTLRRELRLPKTSIETDSFVAVQLIEQQNALNFASLKHMAEEVEGSFAFTVLDGKDNLYFVKGDNPLCLVHFPKTGLYLYASTEEILGKAFKTLRLPLEKPVRVSTSCGDILRVDRQGAITTAKFSTENLMRAWYYSMYCPSVSRCYSPARVGSISEDAAYVDELKSVAGAFGYSPEDIDHLLDQGFTTDEIEEMLYCGEM